jgi:hypothetical protein
MTTRTLAIISVSAVVVLSTIIGLGSGYAMYSSPIPNSEWMACWHPGIEGFVSVYENCRRAAFARGARDGAIAFFVGGAVVFLALRRRGVS